MKLPIRLLKSKVHRQIIEHLKMAGSAQPSDLAEIYENYRQVISNALTDLHQAGLVRYISKDTFPPNRVYEITDYGWNAVNQYELLTKLEKRVLWGKTYRGILKRLQDAPETVTSLAEHFQTTISDISHHLRLLRQEALVDYTRKGKYKMYYITHRGETLLSKNKKIC
jgi:DNA-binding transcriptional ArsR family regulator